MSALVTESASSQEYRKEKERRSHDTIRVCNPTNQDFVVRWDNVSWKFKAGENRDVPRYIAEHYATKIVDSILMKKIDDAVKAENDRRYKKGIAPMSIEYGGEQMKFEEKFKFNSIETRKPYIEKVILGLVEEFGGDTDDIVENNEPEMNKDEDIFNNLTNKIIDEVSEVSE